MLPKVRFMFSSGSSGQFEQEKHHETKDVSTTENNFSNADHHHHDNEQATSRPSFGSSYLNKSAMNKELTPEQIEKMIGEMMSWATPRKKNCKTATGIANATLIEKIARDGRVTREDEQLILSCLDNQRSWWEALIVMFTLNLAIIVPLLVINKLPDHGHFSESTFTILSTVYYTCYGIVFCVSMIELLVVLLMYALSCYVVEMKSTLYLFMQCHDLFVWTNTAGLFPVLAFITATIIGHILMVGPIQSIPFTIMGILTMIFGMHIYAKIIKPIFFGIFNSEFGTWENKRHKRRRNKKLKRQRASNALSSLPSMKSFSRPLKSFRASFKNETVTKVDNTMIDEEAEVDLSSWKKDEPKLSAPPPPISIVSSGKLEPIQTSAHGPQLQPAPQAVTQSLPVEQPHHIGMKQGGMESPRAKQGISKGRGKRGSSQSKNAKLGKQQQVLTAAPHDRDNGTYQPGEEIQDCFRHESPILASEKAKEAPPISSFRPISPQEYKEQRNNRAGDNSIYRNEEEDNSSLREKRSGLLHENIGSSGKPNPTQTSSHPQQPQLDQQAVPHTPPVQHRQTGMQQGPIHSTMTHQGNENRVTKKEQEDESPGDIFFDEEEEIKDNTLDNDGFLDHSEKSSKKTSVVSNDVAGASRRRSWWEGPQNDRLEALVGRLEEERVKTSPETTNQDAEAVDIESGGVPMDDFPSHYSVLDHQHDNNDSPRETGAASAKKETKKKERKDLPPRPWDEIHSDGIPTVTILEPDLKDSKHVKDTMMQQDHSASLRQRLAAHADNVYDSLTKSIDQRNQSQTYQQQWHHQKEDYRTRNEQKNSGNPPTSTAARHRTAHNNHEIDKRKEVLLRTDYRPDPPDTYEGTEDKGSGIVGGAESWYIVGR